MQTLISFCIPDMFEKCDNNYLLFKFNNFSNSIINKFSFRGNKFLSFSCTFVKETRIDFTRKKK
jgi:hypothetical protein